MVDRTAGPLTIRSPHEMQKLGEAAARGLRSGQVVFIHGDLGTGKTTWVRGLLRGLGYAGPVKSPTYTLLECYDLDPFSVYHFDLYRLESPADLEDLAFRDHLEGSGVCLIEWPERGAGLLPDPDAYIDIQYDQAGRRVIARCPTPLGEALCANMR